MSFDYTGGGRPVLGWRRGLASWTARPDTGVSWYWRSTDQQSMVGSALLGGCVWVVFIGRNWWHVEETRALSPYLLSCTYSRAQAQKPSCKLVIKE